ncbi:MAG: HhH-GDP family DNA glycosylase [Desulfobaccales bacterium]
MELISQVLALLKGRFATALGIDVKAGAAARQKWFLAAVLYGARISGKLAARTYQVFAVRGIYTPEAILEQGWDNLVALLDAGGYARYDFKTATKLLKIMGSLQEKHQGSLEQLHAAAADGPDLEQRLQALAPGIGPATVNIFLRELRGVWDKAEPSLSPLAQLAGEHLKLLPPGLSPEEALTTLEAKWRQQPVPPHDFADLEAALVRLGRDFCRKAPGPPCPLGSYCGRG